MCLDHHPKAGSTLQSCTMCMQATAPRNRQAPPKQRRTQACMAAAPCDHCLWHCGASGGVVARRSRAPGTRQASAGRQRVVQRAQPCVLQQGDELPSRGSHEEQHFHAAHLILGGIGGLHQAPACIGLFCWHMEHCARARACTHPCTCTRVRTPLLTCVACVTWKHSPCCMCGAAATPQGVCSRR